MFACSMFHAYAHFTHCQVNYHPRFIEDFGMADDEGLERFWSRLGSFAGATNLMTVQN